MGDRACASTSAKGADARIAGDRACASTSAEGANARNVEQHLSGLRDSNVGEIRELIEVPCCLVNLCRLLGSFVALVKGSAAAAAVAASV